MKIEAKYKNVFWAFKKSKVYKSFFVNFYHENTFFWIELI